VDKIDGRSFHKSPESFLRIVKKFSLSGELLTGKFKAINSSWKMGMGVSSDNREFWLTFLIKVNRLFVLGLLCSWI
jgi:hypothetical protein